MWCGRNCEQKLLGLVRLDISRPKVTGRSHRAFIVGSLQLVRSSVIHISISHNKSFVVWPW